MHATHVIDNAFQGYFRCPDEFAAFDVSRDLSSNQDFFKFGDAACFGRLQRGLHAGQPGGHSHGAVHLPFDLSEVITNLRRERYHQNRPDYVEKVTSAHLARKVYYFLRPILPVAARRHLQKARLSGWKEIAFPHWPVDMTVETVMQNALGLQLRKANDRKIPFIWFWPDGAPSCAILTHDVESKSGRKFCGTLMDLDDRYGLKASFQVVPEKRYEDSQALCSEIRAKGFEVNVHDLNHDGRLFEDRKQFLDRATMINEYVHARESQGFRAAAMYRQQDWFDAFEFSYDMSVPNVAHLEPQRGGCCTVMPYFIGNILELPLTTIQDYSLFHILDDYSTALWRTQIDLIRAANGLVTLLTHPDYLIDERAQAVYCELLAHVRDLREAGDLWFALPRDVDSWWRARNSMSLAHSAGGWSISGTDSARARVAFASIQNGQLVYEVDGRIMRSQRLS